MSGPARLRHHRFGREGLFGGWSQYIYLEPGVGIARLPDSVSVDDYIGGGCGLLTAVHILERAALRPGDSVLVQGVGAVGLSAIALCRLAGASTIFAVGDPAPRLDSRAADGRRRMSSISARRRAEERLQAVRDRTHGEGVDVVIEAAGSARAVEEGLTLVRDGGRYVIAGHYTDVGPSTINAHQHINRKHLEIRGCWGSEPGIFSRRWRSSSARRRPLARHRRADVSAAALNQALADAEAMRITKALVDPWA